MKIETYRKRFNFKYFSIGVVCAALILVPIAVSTTRAKYQTSMSVPLIRGTINFKPYDFKIMAMYQENDSGEYEEVEVMPSSGYVINEEESYCYTVTQEERDDTVVLRTNSEGNHEFGNLKKSSKCYLWFDKIGYTCNGSACETILANKTIAYMPSITGVSSDTSNTLYSVEDDDGTSYVFRGNPSNNWVEFGGFYWRIIRVNGDGSIRMIYNGTSTDQTGEGTQIDGTYAFNSSKNDNAYVGFMYGATGASTYSETHANTNNSTIKEQLDSWYTSSGLSSYADYIDTNAGFCNDRQAVTGGFTDTSLGTLGYGTNATSYAPWGRLVTNGSWKTIQIPTLKCANASNDLFTHSSSEKGNKALTNPVGLITSDEVAFAGGFGGTDHTGYYLYTNQIYWTMSPSYVYSNSVAYMFRVSSSGTLGRTNVSDTHGIRPVINLKSSVTLSGSGTTTSPYTVS